MEGWEYLLPTAAPVWSQMVRIHQKGAPLRRQAQEVISSVLHSRLWVAQQEVRGRASE